MTTLFFVTHPEVIVDPDRPVETWRLSEQGIARMRAFADGRVPAAVRSIVASTETKAIEAAGLLAASLRIGVEVLADLGENDRRSTGFLPPPEFEKAADAFFARPEESFRGWERAVDAQARIRAAVEGIVAGHAGGDLAVVAHGAVGTLLLCSCLGRPISRAEDQPFQGHYFAASLPDLTVLHGWRPIASRP